MISLPQGGYLFGYLHTLVCCIYCPHALDQLHHATIADTLDIFKVPCLSS